MKRIYYYQKTTDDVVDSHDQNFSLPDNTLFYLILLELESGPLPLVT